METLSTVMPIVLYILGAIAIVVLIIVGIKIVKILSGVEEIVRDVEGKVKSLNGVFHIIDVATDKLSFLSDRIVDGLSNFILKIFKKKEKKEKEENEDE